MVANKGYRVTLIREGTYSDSSDGTIHRKCNTILLSGPSGNIIVNPGSVWSRTQLVESLKSAGVTSPESEINYVICTDGRAEHVGCMSIFEGADMMIVGYDIQKKGDLFVRHDFGDGVAPYEFDEFLYVIGTPGKRGRQVSLIVRGWMTEAAGEPEPDVTRVAITGPLFIDKQDACGVSFFDTLEANHGDPCEKENSLNCWRRSRQYVLDRADWIIPAFGQAFKINHLRQYITIQIARNLKQPEFSLTTFYLNNLFKRVNVSLEAAAVELCDLRPGQSVLEIGFGPGLGINMAAERVAPSTFEYLRNRNLIQRTTHRFKNPEIWFPSDGIVEGVDISRFMLKRARALNKNLIQAGVVNLKLASVDHLPMLASTIDACFHVNCFYFWTNWAQSLNQIWRVLRPGGRLITTFRPNRLRRNVDRGWLRYGRADPVSYAIALEACGFHQVEWLKNQMWPGYPDSYEAIVARKPPLELLPDAGRSEVKVNEPHPSSGASV